MASLIQTVPLTASGNILLVQTAQGCGTAGWRVVFTGSSWVGSVVLKSQTNAPGQAQAFTSIAYINANTGATIAADTAITASGSYIIPATSCVYDLYAIYTHTSGSCAVGILTEDASGGGGSGPGGQIEAGNVDGSTSSTFGELIPYTGTYKFPSLFGSTTATATPAALAATTAYAFASTVSGATLMGYGTTNDVALMNRAGTVCLGIGPNTTVVNIPGTLAVTGRVTLANNLKFSAATANIIGGAAAIQFLNAAEDTANVIIADGGAITFRGALSGITTLTASGQITAASGGGGSSANVQAASAAPAGYGWRATGSGADAKQWDSVASGNTLLNRTISDDNGAAVNWMVVTRAGTTVTNIDFTGTASTFTGTLGVTGKVVTYNNIATAGWGVPAIQADGGSAANVNTRSAAAATYTVGAADGTFVVSGNILINSGATFSMSLDVTYTDQGNTSRTLVLPLAQLAGTFVVTGLATNITGTGPYESASMTIRCKASTSITIRPSAGGTYTACNYDVYANIRQVG